MDANSKIISEFNIIQTVSKEAYSIDPMILISIIIFLCLFLYIVGYKLSKYNNN